MGLSSSEAKRLKQLEDENTRLKRLLAEKELEIETLTDVIKRIFDNGEEEEAMSITLDIEEEGDEGEEGS